MRIEQSLDVKVNKLTDCQKVRSIGMILRGDSEKDSLLWTYSPDHDRLQMDEDLTKLADCQIHRGIG